MTGKIEDMKTLVACLRRRPNLTPEQFASHYHGQHARLVRNSSDFMRHLHNYTQYLLADAGPQIADSFAISNEFDAVTTLTFKSAAAMAEAFQETHYLEHIRPDAAKFTDLENSITFVANPSFVKPGNGTLFSLAGKTAVVTGGAKGIGAMISAALVDSGARVLIVARNSVENENFAATLGARGACSLVACDLSDMAGLKSASDAIASRTDKLDILVNNAGSFTMAPIEQLMPDQWDHEIGLNVRAPFFLVQMLLPLLKKASVLPESPARVINIGSIAALWAKSSSAYAYSASKGALHQLTRALASDLTRQGITVNAIAPGFFPSDMTAGFFNAAPGLEEQMIESIPANRLGMPEDIAGAVVFLASRAGAYVSGAILPVEGGLWSA